MSVVDSVQLAVLRLHSRLYVGTEGRIGHRLLGVPSLLLHTTGHRSGQPRTTPLTYATDDGRYLVVASKGGSDLPPGWLANLRAAPQVEVNIGRRRMAATARIVPPTDPDYQRLWQRVNDNNHDRYRGYQSKTERPIPVVVITPS
jgi:deazaflavin-dependent oxidoreductase (nitroreductase family)